MAYANTQERDSLIAGLRSLADFLARQPEVPAPFRADVMVFPADGTEDETRKEVDRIAVLIGAEVNDQTANHGHYTTTRRFGPVEYRAVFISAQSREYRDAQLSYSGNVFPDVNEDV